MTDEPTEAPASVATTGGPTHGRAAFAFIFVTVLLDMLALGIIVPVLPKLIIRFEHGDMSMAATQTGVFAFVWALMQFVFAPVTGALSDRFGRRPVVLLSNFGLGCDYILMALAPTLNWLFSVSYTHLDVYKRQSRRNVRLVCRATAFTSYLRFLSLCGLIRRFGMALSLIHI